MPDESRAYDEDACKKAWKIYCSNFDTSGPAYSLGQAAEMAGISRCKMINYGIDYHLITPSDEEEAKQTLALMEA